MNGVEQAGTLPRLTNLSLAAKKRLEILFAFGPARVSAAVLKTRDCGFAGSCY